MRRSSASSAAAEGPPEPARSSHPRTTKWSCAWVCAAAGHPVSGASPPWATPADMSRIRSTSTAMRPSMERTGEGGRWCVGDVSGSRARTGAAAGDEWCIAVVPVPAAGRTLPASCAGELDGDVAGPATRENRVTSVAKVGSSRWPGSGVRRATTAAAGDKMRYTGDTTRAGDVVDGGAGLPMVAGVRGSLRGGTICTRDGEPGRGDADCTALDDGPLPGGR